MAVEIISWQNHYERCGCARPEDRNRDLLNTSWTVHLTYKLNGASDWPSGPSNINQTAPSGPVSDNLIIVMILSFRTDRPGQTVQTQIRSSLFRVYTVCHSVCIIWTHYSMVEPHRSNFRVIRTNFLGVRIFRKFRVGSTLSGIASVPSLP